MSGKFRPYFLNTEYKGLFYLKALDSVFTSAGSSEKEENQGQNLQNLYYFNDYTIY